MDEKTIESRVNHPIPKIDLVACVYLHRDDCFHVEMRVLFFRAYKFS